MLPLYWPKLALSESTDRYQEKIEPGVCYVDIKNSSFKFAILSKMRSHQHHLAASDKLQFAWILMRFLVYEKRSLKLIVLIQFGDSTNVLMNKSEVYAGDTCFSSLIQFSLFKFWIWIFTLTHFIEVTLKMVEIFRACYKIASF